MLNDFICPSQKLNLDLEPFKSHTKELTNRLNKTKFLLFASPLVH